MASNEEIIYGFLTNDLGFSQAGAAGALGNLEVESGFSPTAYNAREGAQGIGQWENGRYSSLSDYAQAHGGKITDLNVQLGYMRQELTHGYSSVLSAMRSATDPAAAAATWDASYEGSSGTTRTQRVDNATEIYQQIKGGGVLASTANGVPSTSSSPGGATSGPYVVRTDGSGYRDIRIGGKWYDKVDGSESAARGLPPRAYRAMARWLKAYKTAHPDDENIGLTEINNVLKGSTKPSDYQGVVMYYVHTAKPPPSVGALPGAGIASKGLDLFGDWKGLVVKGLFAAGGLGLVVVGASKTVGRVPIPV